MNLKPALALLGTLLVSCAIDDPIDPNDFEVPDPVATLLAPVSGGGQTGPAGVELAEPLRVRVLDQFGDPVPDVVVTWTVVSGSGSVAPLTTVTDGSGVASTRWTLGGTLGEQTAQATTDPATTVARFSATATAGLPATIELGADTLRFDALGDTARVAVTAQDAFGNPIPSPSVTWQSDHLNRATVNGAGLVTATGNGTTRVIASYGNAADTVVVVVQQVVDLVVVTPATDTLFGAGDTVRLEARAYDPNGRALASPTFSWTSTDAAVATVSSSGTVTAVAEGNAYIVATTGGVADSAAITVRIPAALSVTPEADTLAAVGDTLRLRAIVTDAAGDTIDGVPVVWTSLDTATARVDAYGRVTARDTGTASIRVSRGALADTARIDVAPDTSSTAARRGESAGAPPVGASLPPRAPTSSAEHARPTRRVASRNATRSGRRARGR